MLHGSAAASEPPARRYGYTLTVLLLLFVLAAGVRLLVWQDNAVAIADQQTTLVTQARPYRALTRQILEGRGILFRDPPPDPGNARPVLHPPGYSVVLAGIHVAFGPGEDTVRWVHLVVTALAACLVYLFAAELLPSGAAITAGILVALSPHFSYYALLLTPDSLAPVPLLVAAWLLARARRRAGLHHAVLAGLCVGLSCWLRSNALLLAPLLGVIALLTLPPGRRVRFATALVVTAYAAILPITVRNAIVYDRFLPLSIGAGITMVEGIADYDPEGRFGMPQFDSQVPEADARWHGRPDYRRGLWKPDGVERDSARLSRGLAVARENPLWFLGVMLRRAAWMLNTNNSALEGWPFFTANVPIVTREVPFGHRLGEAPGEPVISHGIATGATIAPGAVLTPDADGWRLTGDESAYGDQLLSKPITVPRWTDAVLRVDATALSGAVALEVTDADGRIALASVPLTGEKAGDGRVPVTLRFATGPHDVVRLVVTNNGGGPARPETLIGEMTLTTLGATPYGWTRSIRGLLRPLQREIFVTWHMLPLVLVGALCLMAAARWRALALVASIPAYYLVAQSPLHTEYRYILGIHYFLFVLAGVAVFVAVRATVPLASLGYGRLRRGARIVLGRLHRAVEQQSRPGREEGSERT